MILNKNDLSQIDSRLENQKEKILEEIDERLTKFRSDVFEKVDPVLKEVTTAREEASN